MSVVVTDTITDADNDNLPDNWETAHGFDPFDPNDAESDFDGDGFSNLAEFHAKTNPRDNSEFPDQYAYVNNGNTKIQGAMRLVPQSNAPVNCDANNTGAMYFDTPSQQTLICDGNVWNEFKGEQGEQGLQGEQGEKGIAGLPGERGEKGEKGDKGERGETGLPGVPGIKGERGDRGLQGEPGEKGEPGSKIDFGKYQKRFANTTYIEESSGFIVGNVRCGGSNTSLVHIVIDGEYISTVGAYDLDSDAIHASFTVPVSKGSEWTVIEKFRCGDPSLYFVPII